MGFYKKTVILSNQQNYGQGMVILTIEQNNSGVFGNLRAFDLPKTNNLMLGISVNGEQVIKQNVAFINGNNFDFKLKHDFDINGKIGCVLVTTEKDRVEALVWGTNGTKAEYKKDIINIIEQDILPKPKIIEKPKQDSTIQSVEKPEDKAELFESDDEEIEQIIDSELGENSNDFWSLINEQVQELFLQFPTYEPMQNVMPNSKWVKVDYNNDGRDYILGVIYENDSVKYICYGVPGVVDVDPPEELLPYSQFVPMEEGGYWIMFQDAKTGESVNLNDEQIV